MRRRTLPLPLALAAIALALAPATAPAAPPEIPEFAKELPEIKAGEPVFQFNGKDLTGFYTYLKDDKYEDPKKVFTVVDGMVRASGEQFGGFATKDNFRDYHLIVEWKWGDETFPPREDRTRDSGILLHCVGPDAPAGGQWMESQECQIIEGGSGDFIIVGGENRPSLSCEVREAGGQLYWQPGGEKVTRNSGRYNWWGRDPEWEDVLGFRGENDVEKPPGEWNRMEVVCDGGTITNILNGVVVNQATDSSHTEGKIQFQSEGAEIFFRKIEIRPLIK